MSAEKSSGKKSGKEGKSSRTKKQSRSSSQASEKNAPPDQAARADIQAHAPHAQIPLMLPKGALMALRMTEDAVPEAREVIVYPDGRVTYEARVKPDFKRPRLLTDARIAEMRHALERIDFLHLRSAESTPSEQAKPSAESEHGGARMQIAARLGTRTNSVEYAKGNLPAPLAPLVEQLSGLLPQEHRDPSADASRQV